MLETLSVTNFAIIDHIDLCFRPGMSVLTGETGAGKSLLIDAISLLLGDRASTDMIRSQAEKAAIVGVFRFDNETLKSVLAKNKIDAAENRLVIRREITTQNKNMIKINDQTVTLQQLKEITKYLADVHSQFDTQRLINPANYLELIDGFKREILNAYLDKYRESLSWYRLKMSAYRQLLANKKELLDKNEFYRFQLQELSGHNLVNGEEESLSEQESVLKNFDKIYERLQHIKELFVEGAVLDNLYDIAENFEKVGEVASEYQTNAETTKNFYYELEDLSVSVKKQLASMNFDPEELDRIQERLNTLSHLRTKYHKTIPELIDYVENLKTWIDQTDHFDEYIEKAVSEIQDAFQTVSERAREITLVRRQISDRIEKELKTVFNDLVLTNTEFSIRLESQAPKDPYDEAAFTEFGVDQAEFLISTNRGEPMKPLAKTASGGEMSRIMLAFKTIFIRSQNLSTMVFDEIDTGVSGHVAKQIARKIREIANTCQVISISHIPQVVGIATNHLKVWKQEINNRTIAFVRELTFDERVAEISEMISGDHVTEHSMESARELLLGE